MSWRFPDSNLESNQVITDEGLNDGFMPAATEAQGKINEHNLASAVLAPSAFGASEFLPDTNVAETHVGLEFINTRGSNQTSGDNIDGATRGAWIIIDEQVGHNRSVDKPELDGGVRVFLSPVWSTIGAKYPPFQKAAITAAQPMSVSFFVAEETTLWVMATMQVEEEQRRGQMFALRVNGAVVSESVFGTADLSNERIDNQSASNVTPPAVACLISPAAGAVGNEVGYPVCVECVIDVPPGDVTVDVLAVNVISLSGEAVDVYDGKVCIGGREIVILKMMR